MKSFSQLSLARACAVTLAVAASLPIAQAGVVVKLASSFLDHSPIQEGEGHRVVDRASWPTPDVTVKLTAHGSYLGTAGADSLLRDNVRRNELDSGVRWRTHPNVINRGRREIA